MIGFNFAKTDIQEKLKVSQPGDVYEQEADRVAEQVMRMSDSNHISSTETKKEERIHRKCSACEMKKEEEEEEEENLNISRKSSAISNIQVGSDITNEINNVGSSGGSLLDNDTREKSVF